MAWRGEGVRSFAVFVPSAPADGVGSAPLHHVYESDSENERLERVGRLTIPAARPGPGHLNLFLSRSARVCAHARRAGTNLHGRERLNGKTI